MLIFQKQVLSVRKHRIADVGSEITIGICYADGTEYAAYYPKRNTKDGDIYEAIMKFGMSAYDAFKH